MLRKICAFIVLVFSLPNLASAIDAQLSHYLFSTPKQENYVETHLSINTRSILFLRNANKATFQGRVKITVLFEKNGFIVKGNKYILNSPVYDSLKAIGGYFTDIQRYPLDTGRYLLKVYMTDLADTSNVAEAAAKVDVLIKKTYPNISQPFLLDKIAPPTNSNLTRNSLDLIPRFGSIFMTGADTLMAYCELSNPQNLGADSMYLIKSYIKLKGETEPAFNLLTYDKFRSNQTIIPHIATFPLNQLTAGQYLLAIEIRDRNNILLLENNTPFTILNNKFDADQYRKSITERNINEAWVLQIPASKLLDIVNSFRPISGEFDRNYIDLFNKKGRAIDTLLLRKYIITYWEQKNRENPKKEFDNYMLEVQKVQTSFGSKFKKGFETERGRVYLQYGPPNSRNVSGLEPNAYPYEIWWYYNIKNQRNVRFVFYNPDKVSEDFVLLHSEAFGEPVNPQWRLELNRRSNPTGGSLDNLDSQRFNNYGTWVDDIYRNQ